MNKFPRLLCWGLIVSAVSLASAAESDEVKRPQQNELARPFELTDIVGERIGWGDEFKPTGPLVLVVLRGYPGYQCPLCARQFGELLSKAKAFGEAGATVLFVYPGPAANLEDRAKEFLAGRSFPKHFRFALDRDMKFIESYGLRWNAPGETAHPASFVIDRTGKIRFAKISASRGDRATSGELLTSLNELAK